MKNIERILYISGLVIIIFLFSTPLYAKKLALIIANADYKNVDKLPGTINDAQQITQTLRELDFEIMNGSEYTNLTMTQMDEAITKFVNNLNPNDIAFFYYTGHGTEDGYRNLLIPIDFEPNDPSFNLYLEDDVLEKIKNRDTKTNIIVLDACRIKSSSFLGFTKPKIMPKETIISYVTEPGKYALHPSPYLPSLLNNIKEPGLEVRSLFTRVSEEVSKKTQDNQIPTNFNNLRESFYFREPAVIEATINGGDDDVKIYVNKKQISSWVYNKNATQIIPLNVGSNELEVRVKNARTYPKGTILSIANGCNTYGDRIPEGWNYDLTLKTKMGNLTNFRDKEKIPKKDGPRHGREFTVIRASIKVDRFTGAISIEGVEQLDISNCEKNVYIKT